MLRPNSQIHRHFLRAMCVIGLCAMSVGGSNSAIPLSPSDMLVGIRSDVTPIGMRGGGSVDGAGSGMRDPPIIYLPPSGPSMHSPGIRSPNARAPRIQSGRSYGGQRLKNSTWGKPNKNTAWGNGKRYKATDKKNRRHAGWKNHRPGWKPVNCKDRWHCRHHRYNNRYYYAYYDDWYDFYDYYDSPSQADGAHICGARSVTAPTT